MASGTAQIASQIRSIDRDCARARATELAASRIGTHDCVLTISVDASSDADFRARDVGGVPLDNTVDLTTEIEVSNNGRNQTTLACRRGTLYFVPGEPLRTVSVVSVAGETCEIRDAASAARAAAMMKQGDMPYVLATP